MNKVKLQSTKVKKEKTPNFYAHIDWEKVSALFQNSKPGATYKTVFPSTKQVLHFLAAAGAIGLIFAFPGAAPAIGKLVLGKDEYVPWKMKKTIGQLEKQNFVTVKENKDGSTTVMITREGLSRALTYRLDTLEIRKPRKWDGKWRVVIFDIPEKYKGLRDIFRSRLRQLDLYLLQESVYVSPYPCFSEIEFLRELYGVAFKVRYLLVEKIEGDEQLKSYFSLNRD